MRAIFAFACLGAASVVVGLCFGSSPIGFGDVLSLLLRPDGSAASEVIRELRLPRVLAAFATGGLLAYSGALMQVLLRNPLADPYVLGLSGGSAMGALGAMLLGLGALFVDLAAFLGAVGTLALVFVFARVEMTGMRDRQGTDATPRLLLAGLVVSSGCAAVVTAILVVSPERELRGMLFWLMGDLSGANAYRPALVALPAILVLTYPAARDLNAMLHGADMAHALGVHVRAVRGTALVAASLAAAVAVTTAGSVGFVGLIVPHAVRLAVGNDQRVLLPTCAFAGATLLVVADTLARTAFAPQQVPVGVVTAVIGVPCFLYMLLRRGARP